MLIWSHAAFNPSLNIQYEGNIFSHNQITCTVYSRVCRVYCLWQKFGPSNQMLILSEIFGLDPNSTILYNSTVLLYSG